MEVDFDKEIDTLLRKANRDGPVYVGDRSSSQHLDADVISAFAENAMPEKSRALYSAHLADCDRCRKILSNTLTMNAEALPAAGNPSAITIAERGVEPWYKRLFLFPNLAYLMGGLVLVFSGFLGYTVMQRSGIGGGDAAVSQVAVSESTEGGPNFQDETQLAPDAASSTNIAANAASNTTATAPGAGAANSNAAAATAAKPLENSPAVGGARGTENNFVLDGVSSADSAAAAPAAPPPAAMTQPSLPKDAGERENIARAAKEEDQVAGMNVQEKAKNDAILKQSPGFPTQSGPMRNNESQYNRQLENLEARRAEAKKSARRDAEPPSGRRTVGGKTFEGKQGVWYDTTYQGRPTINVRRGSAEFDRLDSGLRSIANSLSGTVVIVWGAKAYRIQ